MEMWDTLLDYIDESVIIINTERKIVIHNREADRIEQVISQKSICRGDDLLDYVIPERRKIVDEILQQVQKEKLPIRTFAEYPTFLGSKVFLELNYVPVASQAGEISHIEIIGLDVTSQKIFERKMTDLVDEATNLIENANAIIISTDSRGYITHWNYHCRDLFGYERDEVFAQKISILFDGSDHEAFDTFFGEALENKTSGNREVRLKTKTGQVLTIILAATPKLSSANKVTGVNLVGQDITELTAYRTSLENTVEERTKALRHAIRKQEDALEVKSKFVAIASHEFRTPLSSIKHTATHLKTHLQTSTTDEIRAKLDYIEHHSTHMAYLLDDVLTYGKSEPGKIKVLMGNLVVADFIQKIIDEVGHSTNNSHYVNVSFHDHPEQIYTDEKLLRNIVINLLTNAIKFSPTEAIVDLIVEGFPTRLVLIVKDRGIGIPADEFDKIFEPFLRGKAVHDIPGTGLGLPIVKKAIGLLQGEIAVESEPGKGTTFTVSIPLQISGTE